MVTMGVNRWLLKGHFLKISHFFLLLFLWGDASLDLGLITQDFRVKRDRVSLPVLIYKRDRVSLPVLIYKRDRVSLPVLIYLSKIYRFKVGTLHTQ